MKTITEQLHLTPYTSKIFDMYFGGKNFAVFDIETTGLSPARCSLILSGILLRKKDGCEVIQFFADIRPVPLKNKRGKFQIGNPRVVRRKKGWVYL